MSIDLLYYKDKIKVMNPDGHIGILTLWSRLDTSLQKLGELPPSVAAVSNFYGDGISQLIANLLNNPQIQIIMAAGANRSGSIDELVAFFANGVEEIEMNGMRQRRIKGTTRIINEAITGPEMFDGDVPLIWTFENIDHIADALRSPLHAEKLAFRPPTRQPKAITLIEPKIGSFPSVQTGHQIVADDMLDAWREVLHRILRFGNPVQLAKGARRELYNLKVVIRDLEWSTDEEYTKFNLNKNALETYATNIVNSTLPTDATYTYGNRLGAYFGFDTVSVMVDRLVADLEDRKSYVSVWDTREDLDPPNKENGGHPCMVGLFCRVSNKQLLLSATFRTHRAYTAWIENIHALAWLSQLIVSCVNDRTDAGLVAGPLTILSHSISVEPGQIPMVEGIVRGRKWKMRDDSHGDVVFSINEGKILVEHKLNGMTIGKYEGYNAETIGHKLAQDNVVQDLSHALYIGRQLGKLQLCIKLGLEYDES